MPSLDEIKARREGVPMNKTKPLHIRLFCLVGGLILLPVFYAVVAIVALNGCLKESYLWHWDKYTHGTGIKKIWKKFLQEHPNDHD